MGISFCIKSEDMEMLIKDIIAQVRAKLSSEESEKVNSLLSDIIRAESELIADRSSANNESKSRKEKIRELTETIETQKAELETGKTKAAEYEKEKEELEGFKTKWQTGIDKRNTDNKAKWDNISKKFDIKETDPGFDKIAKIKEFYSLDKELTPEQIEKNINLASQHEKLGLFTLDSDPPPNSPKGKDTDSQLKEIKLY